MGAPFEPISPELVLVDPELAERARASLPEEPWLSFIPPPEERPVVAAVPAELPQARRPRRRRPLPALAGAAAVAAVLAALAFGLVPSPGARPTLEPEAAPPPARRPAAPLPAARPRAAEPAAPPARAPAPAKPTRTAAPKPAPKPKPAPRPKPKLPVAKPRPAPAPPAAPKPSRPTPLPKPKPAKPSARPEPFEPARLFVWVPARGAVYYHFVLWRDGKRVYDAFSRKPSTKIPKTVRFTAGSYIWVVRAGKTKRAAGDVGPALVTSTFTIP
jgi:hypothetical protein